MKTFQNSHKGPNIISRNMFESLTSQEDTSIQDDYESSRMGKELIPTHYDPFNTYLRSYIHTFKELDKLLKVEEK